MIAGHPPVVQRDGPEAVEIAGWKQVGGPELMTTLTADCAAWRAFRGAPTTNAAMPGKTLAGRVHVTADRMRDLLLSDAALHAKVKRHATNLLGGLAPDLVEIASFQAGFGNLDDIFIGLAKKEPGHAYSLTVSQQYDLASEAVKQVEEIPQALIDKLPEGEAKRLLELAKKKAAEAATKKIPVLGRLKWSKVVVSYSSSAFPNWSWQVPLTVFGLGLTVSAAGGPFKPPEAGIAPEAMTIDFDGTAKADPAPAAFWGPEDIGGSVSVASAGGAITMTGASLELAAAQIVRFAGTGPSGTLQFGELRGTARKSGGGAPAVSISMGAGTGFAVSDEATSQSAGYKAVPVLVDQTLYRDTISDFAVGLDQPFAPRFASAATSIRQRVDVKREESRAYAAELEALGISEPFRCQFLVEGHASRAWKAATTDDERVTKNQDLSLRRANEVATLLERMLPEPHDFSTVGRGGGVTVEAEGSWARPRVPEAEADRVKEEARKKERRLSPTASEEEIEKKVEALYGKTSEQGEYRAVDVTVSWHGHVIQYEPIAESSPDRPPPERTPPSPGGGGEGGPPASPPGSGGQGGAPTG